MKYTEVVRGRHQEIATAVDMIARGEDPRAIIPIGLRDFDRRSGIKRRQLTLFGAATGEGKSLWVKHLMENAAKRGYIVDVYSFEDPKERTADRTIAGLTGLDSESIGAFRLTSQELVRIAVAAADVEEWGDNINFYEGLRDTSSVLEDILSSSADLVIVDYLQALSEEDGDNLERTLAKFCWKVNKWAQDSGAAIVAMSQVNNKPEERGQRWLERGRFRDPEADPVIEGFRPRGPSDLNWCSAAGHRAKEVGYLFRPGKYLRNYAGVNAKDDVMEISYPKNNFGREGLIRVGLDLKTARFYDLPERNA